MKKGMKENELAGGSYHSALGTATAVRLESCRADQRLSPEAPTWVTTFVPHRDPNATSTTVRITAAISRLPSCGNLGDILEQLALY